MLSLVTQEKKKKRNRGPGHPRSVVFLCCDLPDTTEQRLEKVKMNKRLPTGDLLWVPTSDIVKAESSKEDPRVTGGLVSNLPHPQSDQ